MFTYRTAYLSSGGIQEKEGSFQICTFAQQLIEFYIDSSFLGDCFMQQAINIGQVCQTVYKGEINGGIRHIIYQHSPACC